MEAYPNKVREQVLGAYAQGIKTKEIAGRFGVGPAWCRGVKRRLREQGLRGVIQQKHGPDPILDQARRDQLARLVRNGPGITSRFMGWQGGRGSSIGAGSRRRGVSCSA